MNAKDVNEDVSPRAADGAGSPSLDDLRATVRELMQEIQGGDNASAEGGGESGGAELRRQLSMLAEERDQLVRVAKDEARSRAIREELTRAGVQNLKLAFRAVQEDLSLDGEDKLVAVSEGVPMSGEEYVKRFLAANPELLPARVAGGSGLPGHGSSLLGPDINSIRPGMSEEELASVRAEIVKLAALESVRRV